MKEVLMCPNCGRKLDKDTYEMVSAYHNTMDGVCKLCGHQEHWMGFWHKVETEDQDANQ